MITGLYFVIMINYNIFFCYIYYYTNIIMQLDHTDKDILNELQSNARITNAELAEVLNWILEEFSANTLPEDFKKLSVEEVTEARSQILADPNKYRANYWKAYDFSDIEK